MALLALFGLNLTDNLPVITGYESMIFVDDFGKVFSSLFILLTGLLIFIKRT